LRRIIDILSYLATDSRNVEIIGVQSLRRKILFLDVTKIAW